MSLYDRSAFRRKRSSLQNDDRFVETLIAPIEEIEIVEDSVDRCTRSGFGPAFQDSSTTPAMRNCISGLYAGANRGVILNLPLSGGCGAGFWTRARDVARRHSALTRAPSRSST